MFRIWFGLQSQRYFKTLSYNMATRRSARLSSGADLSSEKIVLKETTEQPRKRKPAPEAEKDADGFAIPSTPKRKRVANVEPPSTPTPLEAKAMAVPRTTNNNGTIQPRKNRVADPRFTNAPLLSPATSRIVSSTPVDQVSPSKLSGSKTTTEHILEKALKHLIEVDARLKPVIEKHPCNVFSPEGLAETIDPFQSLTSGIISQQVSGAAAKSIKAKFVALFNSQADDSAIHIFPSPAQVAVKDIPTLRTAGLSERKAEYIKGLAEKFANGDLSTEMLLRADYDEVLEKLIAVRGLGKWSVEMFACFGLKRMDVFSTGDLGVQRGMAAFSGRDVSKLKAKGGGKWKYMSEKDMLEMAEKYAPYRSVFMWYMWRVSDVVDLSAFEQ